MTVRQKCNSKMRKMVADTGKCQISVKVNEEHICGSPFPVKPKPR